MAIVSNAEVVKLSLARGNPDPAEARESLTDIIADGQRASEVIQRLRLLLKKKHFVPESVSLNELVRDVLKLMAYDLASRTVNVITHLPATLPPLIGDRVQLQQVLINLFLNASDAMNLNALHSAHAFPLGSFRGRRGSIIGRG